MAKKAKGGKKKKKGGKKKTGSKTKKPALSSMERFMQFSVQTRTDQIQALRQRRDELVNSNVELQAQLTVTKEGRAMSIAKMRHLAEGKADEVSHFEAELQQRLQEALERKHASIAAGDAEVTVRRQRLRETHAAIAQATEDLESLRMYKAVGHQELGRQLQILHRTVADLRESHAAALADMQERFERARTRFADNLDVRLERTKEAASETALASHRVRDMAEHADLRWLEQEHDTHVEETSNLEARCLRLEEENLGLLATLSGGQVGTGRWATLETYKRHGEMARGLNAGHAGDSSDDENADGDGNSDSDSEDDSEEDDEEEEDEGEEYDYEEALAAEDGAERTRASVRGSASVSRRASLSKVPSPSSRVTSPSRRTSRRRTLADDSDLHVSFGAADSKGTQQQQLWRLSMTGQPFLDTQMPDATETAAVERTRRASQLKGPFRSMALGEAPAVVARRASEALAVDEAANYSFEGRSAERLAGNAAEQRLPRRSEPSFMASVVLEQTQRLNATGVRGGGAGAAATGSVGSRRSSVAAGMPRRSVAALPVQAPRGAVRRATLGSSSGLQGRTLGSTSSATPATTMTTSVASRTYTSVALPPSEAERLAARNARRLSLPPISPTAAPAALPRASGGRLSLAR